MKDWQLHLINSGIAGVLVFLGSVSALLTTEFSFKSLCIGLCLAFITGLIVFLNKMNDYISSKDNCSKKDVIRHKSLKLFNFI